MSAAQNPSPGRIVHFHEEGGPYPAIVTVVNEDGSVELTTFGRNSLYFQHSVREYVAGENAPPMKGTWTWPPRA
jgi:hypothetical protein